MKKRKIIYILLVGIFAILAIIAIQKSSFQTIKSNAESKVKKENLIAELKDKEISLYYDKKVTSDMLEGFYLKIGNDVKYFDWNNIDKSGFYPTISLIEDKYIAIICTLGEGSGLDVQQLHLINKDSLKEITYQDPLKVISNNVKTEIQAPSINIKINNNEWTSSYPNVKNFSNFFENISYENMITYDIQDSSFRVILKAQVSPSLFIGEFEINYIMDDEEAEFIPATINFNFDDIDIS